MPKTNWQDPGSSEVRSTHISGLQEAVGKIEDVLDMQLQAETGIGLSEVYISEQDRYRIFQAPEGKRNWASDPAPVIKKNGVPIASGFVIDYGGGAVIFSTPVLGSDTVTADFSRVKIEGSIIDGLAEVAHDHDNYDVLALLSEDVDGTLLYNGVPIGATPDAGDIPYDNEESELEATKVQGAIDETVDMVKTHKAENVLQGDNPHGIIYEEGTWTPRLSGNNTYNTQIGNYVRQGNKVTCFFRIELSGKDMPTGPISMLGLPFTPKTTVDGAGGAITRTRNIIFPDGTTQLAILKAPNYTNVVFSPFGDGYSLTVYALTGDNFTDTSAVEGVIEYLI